MSAAPRILVDDPRPLVRRLTLNRPEKRNALDNALRAELFAALEAADRDAAVRATIVRGAGRCFSSGYDLGSNVYDAQPWHTAAATGRATSSRAGCSRRGVTNALDQRDAAFGDYRTNDR